MASRKPITTQVIQQKQLLLKDYLMDDLSSCSSNGFKSFPRHHCCTTTVRFLLDIELKRSSHPSIQKPDKIIHQNHQLLRRSRSRAAAACDAVINAVKNLPFHSVKSPSPSVRKGVVLLPRSLSRRLRRKSFWKKQSKEEKQETDIGRLKSFREFLQEQPPTSDQTATTRKTTITVSRLSSSSGSSESKGNCNSWGESEFTLGSESSSGNDAVESQTRSLVKNEVSERVGVEVGEDSVSIERPTTTTCVPPNAKEWQNTKGEKEQFSPVSVLDCPFEDEDDQISSPFSCSIARMQGTQQKLMQKIRRFENLAQFEPVDLENLMNAVMSDSEIEDEATPAPPMVGANYQGDQINKTEEQAGELAKLFKSSAPSNNLLTLKAEKLVLDLCGERIVENCDENVVMQEVLKVAEDWINGQSQELLLGWEVENGRRVYVNDMDKYCGSWRGLDSEKQEVGLDLELEVWNSLLKELLLDILI